MTCTAWISVRARHYSLIFILTLHTAETNTWTQQEYHSGKPPSKRYGHSAVVYSNCMYVFGGYDDFGYKSNELYEYRFGKTTFKHTIVIVKLTVHRVQTVTSGGKLKPLEQ